MQRSLCESSSGQLCSVLDAFPALPASMGKQLCPPFAHWLAHNLQLYPPVSTMWVARWERWLSGSCACPERMADKSKGLSGLAPSRPVRARRSSGRRGRLLLGAGCNPAGSSAGSQAACRQPESGGTMNDGRR